ncbi:OmpA family protein [bacterium]|nr:OmpA family protein [bacterium]
MKKFIFFVVILLLLENSSTIQVSASSLPVGSLRLDALLNFDVIINKPNKGWGVRRDMLSRDGLAKDFYALEEGDPEENWRSTFGQNLVLNLDFHPYKFISGCFGVVGVPSYADTLWMPINDEHRLKNTKKYIRWTRGELKLESDIFEVRGFRGIGHYHWGYEGDIFGLYPEQNEPEKYRRVSGKSIPVGGEVILKSSVGKLTVVAGPELNWRNGWGIFGKYNVKIGRVTSAIIYKNEEIEWGEPGEKIEAFEFSTKVDVTKKIPFQIGVLYHPFRIGWDYTYVREVAPGSGDDGSKWLVYNGSSVDRQKGTIDKSDAWAFKTKLGIEKLPGLVDLSFTHTYAGIVAGNKHEIIGNAKRRFSRTVTAELEMSYCTPLEGPVPYIYEGTVDNPGPPVCNPRGKYEPFWVGWDNREAGKASLAFNYDPTPKTWFYKWQPNILEEWNLNPEEDAKFSFALKYNLDYYPTSTDLWWIVNKMDEIVWEQDYDPTSRVWGYRPTGKWPTKMPVHSGILMAKFVPSKDVDFLFDIRGGQLLAGSAICYTDETRNNKPITGAIMGSVKANIKDYTARFSYGQDIWGPEEWHEELGVTIDRLFKASLERKLGKYFTVGAEWTGTRETDNKYINPEIGPFDEFRLFCTVKFGGSLSFLGTTPPRVWITATPEVFSPDGDGVFDTVTLGLEAKDDVGVNKWRVEIYDEEKKLVKKFKGKGHPPAEVEWNGLDENQEAVSDGVYECFFGAWDDERNKGVTEPLIIEAEFPPPPVVEEKAPEIPEEIKEIVKVEEKPRGLVVTIKSRVLFDIAKSKLKPMAFSVLDKVSKILKQYPENDVSVEGHADSTGPRDFNQRLSELRAESVADYLITKGYVLYTRIKSSGHGEDRPIASNATRESREQNRRVEIIILKLEEK